MAVTTSKKSVDLETKLLGETEAVYWQILDCWEKLQQVQNLNLDFNAAAIEENDQQAMAQCFLRDRYFFCANNLLVGALQSLEHTSQGGFANRPTTKKKRGAK